MRTESPPNTAEGLESGLTPGDLNRQRPQAKQVSMGSVSQDSPLPSASEAPESPMARERRLSAAGSGPSRGMGAGSDVAAAPSDTLVPHQPKPTVLIVDDHTLWRRGLRTILEPYFEVIGEAADGASAVRQALACRPDVVIMDISLPELDGLMATREIKRALPNAGVIMISAADDDERVYASIMAGVSGYLVKDDTAEAVCEAVRLVAAGEAYLPPPIAKRVLQGIGSLNAALGGAAGHDLSRRELTVLRLLAQGLRHKEIARELHISPRTVSNHIFSIYRKLQINDQVEAVMYAIKQGIVQI
jgi:NarL family two-component system response regulator LiaR